MCIKNNSYIDILDKLNIFCFSLKAGRLLSHIPYQLYTKQSSIQKGLCFNTICKPEDPIPGPSNISVEFNRV